VLYDTPANVFVAGFIGSPAMNIKTVPLAESGGAFANMLLPLAREQVQAAQTDGDGRVTIGFRPEDTRLVGPSDGGLPIVVELVEDLGAHANVYGHATLDGEPERFVATIDRKDMPTMGDTVYFKPGNEHHAFHSVSGQRL
ncbi:MAG: TOBE domain-containing protein, partial [Natronosporangium sp.]